MNCRSEAHLKSPDNERAMKLLLFTCKIEVSTVLHLT